VSLVALPAVFVGNFVEMLVSIMGDKVCDKVVRQSGATKWCDKVGEAFS